MHQHLLDSLKSLPDGSLTQAEVSLLVDEITLLRNVVASFVFAELPDELEACRSEAKQVLGR
jgi:hypothetical protein